MTLRLDLHIREKHFRWSDQNLVGLTQSRDTTSVLTAIQKGYMENGRRYARQKEYWGPADDKQCMLPRPKAWRQLT